MNRFYLLLGRYDTWRDIALSFLAVIFLVGGVGPLFYYEESWRGQKIWSETVDSLHARGETLNYKLLVPAPIPEAQNFTALPLFHLEPSLEDPSRLSPLPLLVALRDSHFNYKVWKEDGSLDFDATQSKLAATLSATQAAELPPSNTPPPIPPPSPAMAGAALPTADPLDMMDKLSPFLPILRQEARTRLLARFEQDNSAGAPYEQSSQLILKQVDLVRIIDLHASFALYESKPDIMMDDVRIGLRINSALQKEPNLIGGITSTAVMEILLNTLKSSFRQIAWNEADLNELEAELSQCDYLQNYQLALRGEATGFAIPLMDKIRAQPIEELRLLDSQSDLPANGEDSLKILKIIPWSSGWFDMNKSRLINFYYDMIAAADPKRHRLSVEQVNGLVKPLEKEINDYSDHPRPWNIFYLPAAEVLRDVPARFALAQSKVDEARIAIALERYWLHHQEYPQSLSDLTTAEAPNPLPKDVVTGQPYQYRLNVDGSYQLYSLGWDQVDDHGKAIQLKEPISEKRGDWVW